MACSSRFRTPVLTGSLHEATAAATDVTWSISSKTTSPIPWRRSFLTITTSSNRAGYSWQPSRVGKKKSHLSSARQIEMTQHPSQSHPRLNVHSVLPVSYANGPGARAVVWTQGCTRGCPGCSNPLTHSHRPWILTDPLRLAASIVAIPGIEGISVTGGEPLEQPAAVGCLCQAVRHSGLSVMVYTGWTYETLCLSNNPTVRDLLRHIDVLVDGPFIQQLADKDLLWRGSRNQHIRFPTNRYSPDVLAEHEQLQVEGLVSPGAPLQLTGFPEESDIAVLTDRLAAEAGILLEPAEPECNENAILKG